MREFVKSLENNQFSKDQEAMLMVRKAEDLQAGSNGTCENSSSSCNLSINERKCTNGTSTGCQGSINDRKCTKLDIFIVAPDPNKEP